MKLTLKRNDTNDDGTDGQIRMPSGLIIFTLELPWKNNQDNISCIPYGIYTCKKIKSPKFGVCYEVLNVPNREKILIHWGNFLKDILGCIEIGLAKGKNGKEDAVYQSKDAFKLFMEEMKKYDEFDLEIV